MKVEIRIDLIFFETSYFFDFEWEAVHCVVDDVADAKHDEINCRDAKREQQ